MAHVLLSNLFNFICVSFIYLFKSTKPNAVDYQSFRIFLYTIIRVLYIVVILVKTTVSQIDGSKTCANNFVERLFAIHFEANF